MFRTSAILALTALLATNAFGSEDRHIAVELSRYIAAFDLTQLDAASVEDAEAIMNDRSMSHGQKVLALHTLLARHGALEHLDMHGARNFLTADMR